MTSYHAETPERGFTFLGDEVRRKKQFPREEVEAALRGYQEVAAKAVATGDWNAFADQFTEDAIYVEHHFGVLRGQDEIRSWIVSVMEGQALDLVYPVLWHLIDNDIVFIYCPNRYDAPDGGAPFQFVCGTMLCYAGDGRWCYEEDLYNLNEAIRVGELYAVAKDAAAG
jgi:ketosteroid isomerase-like protein